MDVPMRQSQMESSVAAAVPAPSSDVGVKDLTWLRDLCPVH